MKRFRLSRRSVWVPLALAFGLSFAAAIRLTSVVRASQLEIGLDLIGRCAEAPLLSWGDEVTTATRMRAIPDSYTPKAHAFEFEIIATGRKNPASRGTGVAAMDFGNLYLDKGVEDPPRSWRHMGHVAGIASDANSTGTAAFSYREYASAFSSTRKHRCFTLCFSPRGGIAVLNLPNGSKTVDLYSPEDRGTLITLEPKEERLNRYYAAVPREKFCNGRIIFSEYTDMKISRLYFNSFVPRIFFRADRDPLEALGRITENWQAERQARMVRPISLVDEYAPPALENGVLALPPLAAWERGGFWTFVAAFLACLAPLTALWGVLWLATRLARWLWIHPLAPREIRPFRVLVFVSFAIPLLAVWLFYWGAFYPAIMSKDSKVQWEQAHGIFIGYSRIANDNPAFHVLCMKALYQLWDTPAVVSLAQILAMTVSLAYALTLLLRLRAPRLLVAAALLTAVVSLNNGLMAVTLWKDIPYTVVVVAITVILAQLCLGRSSEGTWAWAALGLLIGVAPGFRHNGLILLGLPVLLLLFFRRQAKRVCITFLTAIGVYLALLHGLYPLFNVDISKGGAMIQSARAEAVGKAVDLDVPLSPEECRILDTVEDSRLYTGRSGVAAALTSYLGRLFPRSGPGGFSAVRILQYLHHHANMYWPPQLRYIEALRPTDPRAARYDEIAAKYGFAPSKSLLPKAEEWLMGLWSRAIRREYAWFVFQPGLQHWLILASAFILLWRTRNYRLLAIYLPVALNTAALLLVDPGPNPCLRYYFPATFTAGFFLCLAFVPRCPGRPTTGPRTVCQPE